MANKKITVTLGQWNNEKEDPSPVYFGLPINMFSLTTQLLHRFAVE